MAFPNRPLTQLHGSNGMFSSSHSFRHGYLTCKIHTHRSRPRLNLLLHALDLHPRRLHRPFRQAIQPLPDPAAARQLAIPRATAAGAAHPDLFRARLRGAGYQRRRGQCELRVRGRRSHRVPVGRGHGADTTAIRREPRAHGADQLRGVCWGWGFGAGEREL